MADIDEYPLKTLTPENIGADATIASLIEVVDPGLVEVTHKCGLELILQRIDDLPEEVLDLLLWQFHVTLEGFEIAVSIEEKRDLVKRAIEIHRLKGTKAALLRIFDMLSMRGVVSEWYEYGGEPFKFKIKILEVSNRGLDEQTYGLLERLIQEYKNVRSWLEELNIYLTVRNRVPEFAVAGLGGEEITVYPYDVTEVENTFLVRYGIGCATVETVTVYPF